MSCKLDGALAALAALSSSRQQEETKEDDPKKTCPAYDKDHWETILKIERRLKSVSHVHQYHIRMIARLDCPIDVVQALLDHATAKVQGFCRPGSQVPQSQYLAPLVAHLWTRVLTGRRDHEDFDASQERGGLAGMGVGVGFLTSSHRGGGATTESSYSSYPLLPEWKTLFQNVLVPSQAPQAPQSPPSNELLDKIPCLEQVVQALEKTATIVRYLARPMQAPKWKRSRTTSTSTTNSSLYQSWVRSHHQYQTCLDDPTLPLVHFLVYNQLPPIIVLIAACVYPHQVSQRDAWGNLPLHYANCSASAWNPWWDATISNATDASGSTGSTGATNYTATTPAAATASTTDFVDEEEQHEAQHAMLLWRNPNPSANPYLDWMALTKKDADASLSASAAPKSAIGVAVKPTAKESNYNLNKEDENESENRRRQITGRGNGRQRGSVADASDDGDHSKKPAAVCTAGTPLASQSTTTHEQHIQDSSMGPQETKKQPTSTIVSLPDLLLHETSVPLLTTLYPAAVRCPCPEGRLPLQSYLLSLLDFRRDYDPSQVYRYGKNWKFVHQDVQTLLRLFPASIRYIDPQLHCVTVLIPSLAQWARQQAVLAAEIAAKDTATLTPEPHETRPENQRARSGAAAAPLPQQPPLRPQHDHNHADVDVDGILVRDDDTWHHDEDNDDQNTNGRLSASGSLNSSINQRTSDEIFDLTITSVTYELIRARPQVLSLATKGVPDSAMWNLYETQLYRRWKRRQEQIRELNLETNALQEQLEMLQAKNDELLHESASEEDDNAQERGVLTETVAASPMDPPRPGSTAVPLTMKKLTPSANKTKTGTGKKKRSPPSKSSSSTSTKLSFGGPTISTSRKRRGKATEAQEKAVSLKRRRRID